MGDPRPHNGFMYISEGKVLFTYKDGSSETFKAGDLLYIPKGCEYETLFFSEPEVIADLLVQFEIRDLNGNEYLFAEKTVRLLENTPERIAKDFWNIRKYSANVTKPYLQITKTFYGLLEKIQAQLIMEESDSKGKSVIAPAILYLDFHVGDNISVADLAKMCLMSETAFRLAFRDYTGMSPAKYRTALKIQKAQNMLQSSPEISVAEVAEGLGFYDISHFHKTFTAHVGMTPDKFRKQS
ncbi:MAG: helix-turn-helix domain-containing protein [Clostridia bacterium]|nr:helix-turn-helix domain-containing protein [Clostridia bacterium]